MPHVILSEDQLRLLVARNLTQREIAKELNTVQSDVRYWLNTYGLRTSFGPHGEGRISRVVHMCPCGESNPERFHPRRRSICKKCHNRETVDRLREYKRKAVEYKGGCCQTCNHKVIVALLFHHIDPALKPLKWRLMKNWSFDRIKTELDTTILLCYNCHAEIHYGDDESVIRQRYQELVGVEIAELTYYRRDRGKKHALQRERRLPGCDQSQRGDVGFS